eukprot:c28634_g1_i2 orf=136-2454(-)
MVEANAGGNLRGVASQPRGTAVLPPFQAAIKMLSRDRFYVELKPDETTVVSWKKLVKDSQKNSQSSPCEAPVGAHPALEARIAPELATGALNKDPLPPPPNRFNSVIEKIERLYKGAHSSDEDENLSDVPDDDKYDTSDSFIDDEELNEYFSVDKSKTKHTGFFVNRGKLEKMSEPPSLPVFSPKKRKRKDIKKLSNETGSEDLPKKLLKSGVRMKAAARKVSLSTVIGTSIPSENTSTLLTSLTRDTAQSDILNGKDSRIQYPGFEASKVREDCMSEGKVKLGVTVTNSVATVQNVKDALPNASEGREIATSLATEGMKNSTSIVNVPENSERYDQSFLHKNDLSPLSQAQIRDISKDLLLVGMNKGKPVQRGNRDDDAKEAVGVGNKLSQGIIKSSLPNAKDVSPGRPKCTVLERAIQDLEKGVAELCPSYLDLRESEQTSQSGGKSKRLPRDVKQKLAKVARLAAKQGKLSDDFIDRLMGILGHMMRVKTLKRNLKEMIEMGLSARQEKEGRLLDIKREVTEMVKSRVYSLQAQEVGQQEDSPDDFQAVSGSGERGSMSGRYQWDHATEDRICDLYEQYIEGMDEHKGPQIRKLYAELAELWPGGWMDNIGIKRAVQRAKDRKKMQNKPDNCRKSRRKQKTSEKHLETMGAEGILLCGLSYSSQSKILSDQVIGLDYHQTEGSIPDAHNEYAYEDKRKYLKSPPSSVVGSFQKKRKKLKGIPPFRKKNDRKFEKAVIDSNTLSRRCATNVAQMSSNGESMQTPPCRKVD